VSTVITDLVQPALIGWGFHCGSVMEALNPDYWKQYYGDKIDPMDKCNWTDKADSP
jgi:hypothetical protein